MKLVLNLLAYAISLLANRRNSFVVQTTDGKLHFITDKVASHQLFIDSSVKLVENNEPELKKLAEEFTQKQDVALQKGSSVVKANRIDRIFVSHDGYIDIFGRRVYFEDILLYPLVDNGIYISASQNHIPKLINKTVVITADTRIQLLDLYCFSSKILTFKQVLYLSEIYMNIQKTENRIYLNKKWWDFDTRIIAVYVLKEKEGLNFMLRVFGKTEIAIYKHKTSHKGHGKKSVIIITIAVCSLLFWFYRNLIFETYILEKKLYIGKFIKKRCLIYQISGSFLKEYRKSYGKFKHNSIVNNLTEIEGWVSRYLVTEFTHQFFTSSIFTSQKQKLEASGDSSVPEAGLSSPEKPPAASFKTYADYFNNVVYDEAKILEIAKLKKQMLGIAKTIEYLHSIGIVHGRLCPENIRVTENSNIKLQNMFENSGWRSCNQLQNIKNKSYKPDETDDLLTIGCIFHYYLTGYSPFDLRGFVKKQRKSFKNITDQSFPVSDITKCKEEENSNQQDNVIKVEAKENLRRVTSILMRINLLTKSLYNFFIKDMPLRAIKKLQQMTFVSSCIKPVNFVGNIRRCVLKFFFYRESDESISKIYFKVLDDEAARYVEYNVIYNTFKIRLDDQVEHDLIYHCIKAPITKQTPKISFHPYFWTSIKCMEFICDVSDFLETNQNFKPKIEKCKRIVFSRPWIEYIDISMVRSMSLKRSYDYQSLCDLIRFIRNSHRHYQELRNKETFEILDGKIFYYFSHTFPEILMLLYRSTIFIDQIALKKYYQ
ncbi:bifunctional endoribonuclease/protein kinase ire1 [Glugoides intestinalis]